MLITNFRLKYVLYKIVCAAYQLADVGRIHPTRERALRALQRTVDYIERAMPDALGLESQRELIDFILQAICAEGYCLEFGVFTGGTIRYIAKRISPRTAHGFDSFEGIAEGWSGFSLANKTFDVKSRPPRMPGNVQLHRGYFDASLPQWLADNPGPVAFVHVDCNLYSSTKTVLDLLAPRFVPGSVILFDEYFNYPGWEQHEFKAFQEFVSANAIKYDYLAFARQQVGVRITSIGAGN
jgi:Methyltransferase domain